MNRRSSTHSQKDLENKLKELAESLVEFETTEEQEKEISNCLEFIEDYFPSKFTVQRFAKEGKPSLLISLNDSGLEPEILLHGHIDVVEAEESGMFEPKADSGKLYGRGTADMKAGVAVLMKIMKDLEPENCSLLISSDEEVGGFKGTGYLVDEIGLRPDFALSAEPCIPEKFPSVVNQHKGVFQVKLETEGESCHASKPENGVNAIDKLIDNYRDLKQVFAKKGVDSTVNLGSIEGGDSLNQVPGKAKLKLDIRYNESLTPKEILDFTEGLDVSYSVIAEAPMMKTPEENEYVQKLAESTKEAVSFDSQDFASDMRFFTEKDIPAVLFGPAGRNIHGKEEHVLLESLPSYYNNLEGFLDR